MPATHRPYYYLVLVPSDLELLRNTHLQSTYYLCYILIGYMSPRTPSSVDIENSRRIEVFKNETCCRKLIWPKKYLQHYLIVFISNYV